MKIIGAVLIVICARLLGNMYAGNESKKLLSLSAVIRLLEYMRLRMTLARSPLHELFSGFCDGYLEKSGFLGILRAGERGFPQRWLAALDTLVFDADTLRELKMFGSELGRLLYPEQEKRLLLCLETLKKNESELKITLPNRTKSLRTVSTLFGLLAAVIMI